MKSLVTIITVFLVLTVSMESISQTTRSVNEAKGLATGLKAPIFKARDQNGKLFSLDSALKKGPVVVIFYRGYWCPYCNKHLQKLQDSLSFIYEKGASVVAISPEKPEYALKTVEKTHASFTLLYDEGYRISDAFDLTFLPSATQLVLYNIALNGALKKSHSDESQRLPIPATYIINQEGIIIWRQFDPNYKIRSNVKDIIENIH